jgi:16S rRNA (guanine966-N2)-methyltransferase
MVAGIGGENTVRRSSPKVTEDRRSQCRPNAITFRAVRIIAGQFRSRVLLGPEDERTTRPITDRVKQSLFDIVTPWIEGGVVYDCFAGTGSMGLESLSRGAAQATFFEADRSALVRLKKNIAALGVGATATVVAGDIFKYFDATPLPQRPAALIFLDPPYRYLREQPERLRGLAARLAGHLAADGQVVFRHDAVDRLELPALAKVDERTYGQMTLEFLTAPKPATNAPSPS